MRALRIAPAAVALVLAGCWGTSAHAAPGACGDPPPSTAYRARVAGALAAGRDLLGERLLRTPGGPTVARARALLAPLWWARGPHGEKLTASGVYYVPFADPGGPQGAVSVALHVADGSQIVAQRVGGPSLELFVGDGSERYGSCLGRLAQPRLADGGLPLLETAYSDAGGVRYRQESFARRSPATGGLVSYVRLDVDARHARRPATVRIVGPPGRLVGPRRALVPRGSERTLYLAFADERGATAGLALDASSYAAARADIAARWAARLAAGASISVPDPDVEHALRAATVQDLELTWRYSIGNPYEEFSFPESVDVARVLAELGQTQTAEAILGASFRRVAEPYPNWKRGEVLVAVAELYRLSDDAAFVAAATPALRRFVAALAGQIDAGHGLLGRERYSSDIPASVLGLHGQAVAWEGLEAMAAVWAETGQPALAADCRRLGDRLGAALRRAAAASERRLPDGSLFVPASLLDGERPYERLTQARLGSYWNLVVPYALASGLFRPGSTTARGVLAYLERHGSLLLGVIRSGGYALYGPGPPAPVSGTDAVYDNALARFLADEDEPDLLDLTLAGGVGAAMTAGTYVAGEAASVAPLGPGRRRSMYLPPNGAAAAAFLETLRLTLVHETRSATGRPEGLQLAFATPRGWLRPGGRFSVSNLPTSFGPVSYTVVRRGSQVTVTLDEPSRTRPAAIALRLRLPAGERVGAVTVGGHPHRVYDPATGTIRLPVTGGRVLVVARVA